MYETRQNKVPISRIITNSEIKGTQKLDLNRIHQFQNLNQKKTDDTSTLIQMLPNRNSNDAYDFSNISLQNLYEGRGSIKNNIFTKNSAFLGWDSFLLFHKNNKKLGFQGMGISSMPNYKTQQVVTRGIDTCTFVAISLKDKTLSAHYDASQLEQGLETIKKELPPIYKNVPRIFVSVLDDRYGVTSRTKGQRVKFVTNLIDFYNNAMHKKQRNRNITKAEGDLSKLLVSRIDQKLQNKIRVLVRNMRDDGENVQHPEIGIYLNNGELRIFGSFSNSKENELRVNELKNNRYFDLSFKDSQDSFSKLSKKEGDRLKNYEILKANKRQTWGFLPFKGMLHV